jgi:hypothetical protein
VEEPTNNIE